MAPKTRKQQPAAAGNVRHRAGCQCEACELIRKGDIARIRDAVKDKRDAAS
jgi:hypothetical protein